MGTNVSLVYHRALYHITSPGNVAPLCPDYHDIQQCRNANREEQDYADPRIHTEKSSSWVIDNP